MALHPSPDVGGRVQALTESLTRALPVLEEIGGGKFPRRAGIDLVEVKRAVLALADEARILETLNRIGRVVSSETDPQQAVKKATDIATQLIGAAFGAFEPTLKRKLAVRSDDIIWDVRCGSIAPPGGWPPGRPPVRSYLAVPVISRAGDVLGSLIFGHPGSGMFGEHTEQLAQNVACHVAAAIENIRFHEVARKEILARTRAEAALRDSECRCKAVLGNVALAVLLTDRDGHCTYMNAAAERLTGYQLTQIKAKPLDKLIRHSRPDGSGYSVEAHPMDSAIPVSTQQAEALLVHPDGSLHPVALTTTPIRDESAQVLGTIVEVRDIRAETQEIEQLQAADRKKNEFLAVLAHELRNPLAPLQNALQIVRRRVSPTDAAFAQLTDMMERQIGHLVRLVDDLLDLSRVTHGRVELRREPVPLREIVDMAVEISRPLIDGHGHELTVHCRDERLVVNGDLQRLAQAVSNLLSNSAKYTPQGGRITLTAERVGDDAVVSVTDTGIGISPESLPNVFEMFFQGDAYREQSQGGLGIGLALVRRLVHLHGGTVTAHSDGIGTGSRFTVLLPALPPSHARVFGKHDVSM